MISDTVKRSALFIKENNNIGKTYQNYYIVIDYDMTPNIIENKFPKIFQIKIYLII